MNNCKVSLEKEKLYLEFTKLMDNLNLKDGMTVSFHHHLRNGDFILNMVMDEIAKRGYKDVKIAASSIFPCHKPLVQHIENGVVTGIYSAYISGPVAEAISAGKLATPALMHTHGGRARLFETGEAHIDIAFLAAPTSDEYGNINGVDGKSACGALGYAHTDADYADTVVVITDNLVSYPNPVIEIDQTKIDYVLVVDAIGDPKGIVSGTTQVTKNPIGLKIANLTTKFIENSGYFKNGMSFQTGAGGISLAVAAELKNLMKEKNVVGSFASGGITGYIVDMYKEGLFKALFDVQCFDLAAIESARTNREHITMSASMYANANNKGAVVDKLDVVILGATEIDHNFNVNVTTGSSGIIMGGSGGHADTAAGSKLSIIVSQLVNARISVVKDHVTTITTPGDTVDVLVTEYGVAINPKRLDLIEKFKDSNLPIKTIEELGAIAKNLTGEPTPIEFTDKIVANVQYRDGSIIDTIKMVK
ncbi:MAG: citrate lyase subunit alpha [Cetobacterium sp.]|uniref:citrate lyase subunit alpha n=1 Tax=unclassified Cetobacterium TaxID=2630983 RepID=UPI00163C4E89|nr:citrate lyase subunit alpha [Cetobacterium sp. 2A]MBC2856479.1 citrate lyase subunit alpha [Cetobacterium sp. 2A]